MRKTLLFMVCVLIVSSCASSKVVGKSYGKSSIKANKIISNALKYKGVKYKFGGTTAKGMDCSGIVYVAFGKEYIKLPRVSKEMAKIGKNVKLKNAKKGDVIFFRTSKKKWGINHVGLIVSVKKETIKFIHATSSKGVIISSLTNSYWKKAFVKVTRILY